MRQRGAAYVFRIHNVNASHSDRNRKVDHVDFGLSFPSSARSRRATTITPQSRRSSVRQTSKTPTVQRMRGNSANRSVRQTSVVPDQEPRLDETPEQLSTVRSSKRRRLSSASHKSDLSRTPATLASTRTTKSSSGRHKGIFAIAEDEDTGPYETPLPQNDGVMTGLAKGSSTVTTQLDPDKENDVSGPDEAEVAASVDSPSQLLEGDKSRGVSVEQISIEAKNYDRDVEADGLPEIQPGTGDAEDVEAWQQSAMSDSMLESAQTIKAKQKKRKKRKIVVLGRKKKRLSDQSAFSTENDNGSGQSIEFQAMSQDPPLSTPVNATPEADEDSDMYESPGPSHPRSPDSRREITPKEVEEEGDETYIQDASPEPPTPAPTKIPSKKRTQPRKPGNPEARARSKSARPTFPILTHRMTNVSTLPTIHEDDRYSQTLDDGLPASNLLPERSQPNAVDVLAQICRETITNLIESMAANTQPSERAAVKNKRTALEAFGEDLDEELFRMSEAVENRIDLEARVRKSKREKSSLQSEYIEIRKERERIALKCDSARRRHWECEQDAREKWNISEAARRVELDMDRDEERVDEGVEFLLRSVTNNVSNLSDAGGILDKAKAFNAQLEAMALLLESWPS